MEKHGSAHLPSVDLPSTTLSKLKENFAGKTHVIVDEYTTKNLPLNSQNNLILVHLPDTGPTDDQYEKSLGRIG